MIALVSPALALFVALTIGGCASYVPAPLPTQSTLASDFQSLKVSPAQIPFRPLAAHRFDPGDGLDSDEVAMLAVVNNPQLRIARDALGIATAQAFAAGLLPDPQLGLTTDHPTNGVAGNTNAFNLNLGIDVTALLTRSSRAAAADDATRQVDLDLLWQEWQVVSQARLLFVRLRSQQRLLATLADTRALLHARSLREQQALAAGDLTLDVTAADFVAEQATARQINDLERTHLQDEAALASLLGIAPSVKLRLVGNPVVDFSSASSQSSAPQTASRSEQSVSPQPSNLDERLARRPDMQALRAGYASQEARFRGAVLAQFPALNVGITRARDTGGLYTLGFGLNLSLPIFNRNRGNIAIEQATRAKLRDEYQLRLNSARSDVAVALQNLPLLQDQLARTRASVDQLARLARHADAAFTAGNLSATDRVRLKTAWLDKQVEAIQLEEALTEQRIALQTLLGPELAMHEPATQQLPTR